MKSPADAFKLIAAFAAICVLAACATPQTPSKQPVLQLSATRPAALRLEGLPTMPASLLEASRRYNGVAGHGFARRENADYYFAALVKFIEQTLRP